MAKCQLSERGSNWDSPPRSLQKENPQLYAYLLALHRQVFGLPPDTGILNEVNISADLSVDHSKCRNLDHDDHKAYLTTTRHAAIRGNVHGVTADDVGRMIAQWNAEALRGIEISQTLPTNGQALAYNAAIDEVVWSTMSMAAGLDQFQFAVPITGANGSDLTFDSPVQVRFGLNGLPQAIILRGAGIARPDTDPPAAGHFCVRAGTPQTIVMAGNPPLGTQYFGFLLVVTA